MQEGERGRERERGGGDRLCNRNDVTSGEGPGGNDITGGELAGPKFEGDTPVMSSNSVARRREIFGCRANRRI